MIGSLTQELTVSNSLLLDLQTNYGVCYIKITLSLTTFYSSVSYTGSSSLILKSNFIPYGGNC